MWRRRTLSISLLLVMMLSASVLTDGDGTTNNENGAGGDDGRIINGEEATPHEFPFQVAVVSHVKGSDAQSRFCGGVIIHEKYILTAAHCTNKAFLGEQYSQLYFKVYAGDHALPDSLHTRSSSTAPGTGQTRVAKAIFEHPDFQAFERLENDIAVLEVEPLELSASGHVEKIALPDADYIAKGEFTAMGWGRTNNSRPADGEIGLSRHLMKTNLPFVPDDVCSEIFKNKKLNASGKPRPYPPVQKSMLCAGGAGKDICQGDSGGSLIKDENGKRLIVGIVSWGNGQWNCGKVGVPSVFTEVSQYRQWIQDRFDGKPLNKSGRFRVGSAWKLSLSIFYPFPLFLSTASSIYPF